MRHFIPPKFFRIEELVSQRLFDLFKHRQHILWQQFDPRILYSIYQLRLIFNEGMS